MRSCRVCTLRATYFCRTRGFHSDETFPFCSFRFVSSSSFSLSLCLFLFLTLSRFLAPSLSSNGPRCCLLFLLFFPSLSPSFFYYSRSFYSWFFIRRCALGERTFASMRKPAYYFAGNMHFKLVFLSGPWFGVRTRRQIARNWNSGQHCRTNCCPIFGENCLEIDYTIIVEGSKGEIAIFVDVRFKDLALRHSVRFFICWEIFQRYPFKYRTWWTTRIDD